eukprot:gene9275-biopygen10181
MVCVDWTKHIQDTSLDSGTCPGRRPPVRVARHRVDAGDVLVPCGAVARGCGAALRRRAQPAPMLAEHIPDLVCGPREQANEDPGAERDEQPLPPPLRLPLPFAERARHQPAPAAAHGADKARGQDEEE